MAGLAPLTRGALAPRLGTHILGGSKNRSKKVLSLGAYGDKMSDYCAIETGLIPGLVVVELVQRFWCAKQEAGRTLVGDWQKSIPSLIGLDTVHAAFFTVRGADL